MRMTTTTTTTKARSEVVALTTMRWTATANVSGTEMRLSLEEVSRSHRPFACIKADKLLSNAVGKVIRDGMGQATGRRSSDVLDLMITNALIVDWGGI